MPITARCKLERKITINIIAREVRSVRAGIRERVALVLFPFRALLPLPAGLLLMSVVTHVRQPKTELASFPENGPTTPPRYVSKCERARDCVFRGEVFSQSGNASRERS